MEIKGAVPVIVLEQVRDKGAIKGSPWLRWNASGTTMSGQLRFAGEGWGRQGL
jgi:hypothetical protein